MSTLKVTPEGIKLLHDFEQCRLKAYLCPAGVWTIGWGNTFYADGSKVKPRDTVTQTQADALFEKVLNGFAANVESLLKAKVTPNQFSALVSFTYNCGVGNLQKSTLLKKVNANPNDPAIRAEFMKWNKGAGRVMAGLTRRRGVEADLYFRA